MPYPPGHRSTDRRPATSVVAVVLADSDWSVSDESRARLARQVESSSTTVTTGARWATVGRFGVLVVPMTGDGTRGHAAVEMLCAEVGEHIPDARLRVAVGGATCRPGRRATRLRTGPRHARSGRAAGVAGRREPGRRPAPRPPGVGARRRRRAGRARGSPHPGRSLRASTSSGRCVSYLATGLSVEATSRALGVHPSTVRARLGRIERLLGGRDGRPDGCPAARPPGVATWARRRFGSCYGRQPAGPSVGSGRELRAVLSPLRSRGGLR